MSLGASLFLLAFGAILAYAVQDDAVSWIDLGVVGLILMAVGAVGLVLTLLQSFNASRR